MRVFKWLFWLALWAVIGGFLHYTLPQRDIVRLTETEIRRVDVGERPRFWASADAGTNIGPTRDVRFVVGFTQDGEPRVYRNEDTAWGWPPYLKFDSADVQAQAGNLVSTEAAPQWVAVRHYGWRSNLFSIFPNALDISPVAGPEARDWSWATVVLVTLLVLFLWFLVARWRRFKEDRITPVLDDADAAWDMRVARWRRARDKRRADRLARGR